MDANLKSQKSGIRLDESIRENSRYSRAFLIFRFLILALAIWGVSEWSFRRGIEFHRQQEAANWDGFMMDAWGFRPPPAPPTPSSANRKSP
jgi:hypothetical protein